MTELVRIDFIKEVPASVIRACWRKVKRELAGQHLVYNVKMPNIEAFIVTAAQFRQNIRTMNGNYNGTDYNALEEYGRPTNSAEHPAVMYHNYKDSWTIFSQKGKANLDDVLEHEIRHVFEHFLGLKCGALT